jgi:transposase
MSKKIPLKHYTLRELAKFYGVCEKTFKKWITPFLSEIGEKNGKFYSIAQVRIIFQKLELPSYYEVEGI